MPPQRGLPVASQSVAARSQQALPIATVPVPRRCLTRTTPYPRDCAGLTDVRSRAHSSSAFCRGHDGIRPAHSRPRSDGGRMLLFRGTSHGAYGPRGIRLDPRSGHGLSWSTPQGRANNWPSSRHLLRQLNQPRGSGGMADAHGSGPCARKGVRVQLPPSPPPRATSPIRVGSFWFPARRDHVTAGFGLLTLLGVRPSCVGAPRGGCCLD